MKPSVVSRKFHVGFSRGWRRCGPPTARSLASTVGVIGDRTRTKSGTLAKELPGHHIGE
jgi:hypothetical protein